jgi:hypothetical protein
MAITIDAYTVVAQLRRVQHLLDSDKLPTPNSTILADDDLWRCSFMTHSDANIFGGRGNFTTAGGLLLPATPLIAVVLGLIVWLR